MDNKDLKKQIIEEIKNRKRKGQLLKFLLEKINEQDSSIFSTTGINNLRNKYYFLISSKSHPGDVLLNNFLSTLKSIQEPEAENEEIYALIYFTYVSYRYGKLTITKKNNTWIKATIEVFSNSHKDENTPYYKFESDNIKTYPGFLNISFSSSDKLKSVLNLVFDTKPEFNSDHFFASYSSISSIKGGDAPTAGIMAFKKVENNFNNNSYSKEEFSSLFKNANELDFFEFFLRNKRVYNLHNSSIHDLTLHNKYFLWKNIFALKGIYIGWTIRSWAANYRTFDRFFAIIEPNGSVLLFGQDLNPFVRKGNIHQAEKEHIIIHFNENVENINYIRFSFTLVADPTTLNDPLKVFIGVTSGLESFLTPTSGKVVLSRFDDSIDSQLKWEQYKLNNSQFSNYLKPHSESTSSGLKYIIDSDYASFITFIKESGRGNNSKIFNSSPYYLSNIFSPNNFYDFSDTNVLVRNWLGESTKNREDYHILIFSIAGEFSNLNPDPNKLNIYLYPMRIQSDLSVFIKTINSNFLAGKANQIQDFLVFTCFIKHENKNEEFFIQGIIKDWNNIKKNSEKEKQFSEGIINIHSKDKGYLKSSKIVVLKDSETYSNFNSWNNKFSVEKDTENRLRYHIKEDMDRLESYKPGLSQYLRGNLNRLIVSKKDSDITPQESANINFPKTKSEESALYFYAACFSVHQSDEQQTKNFLLQAWIHGFPSNDNEKALFVKEYNSSLNNFQSFITDIWDNSLLPEK